MKSSDDLLSESRNTTDCDQSTEDDNIYMKSHLVEKKKHNTILNSEQE